MKMKFTLGDISVEMKTDGETPQDAVELASTILSWSFEQPIELFMVEEEDEAIYCEGIEPIDEREMDGL
tara:strand:- start:658 stop:864 length:207 start_codon:yes stop_codon:yes gene_type:complete